MVSASCFGSLRKPVAVIIALTVALAAVLAAYSWTGEWFGRRGDIAAFFLMCFSTSQAMMLTRTVDAHVLLDRMYIGKMIDACAPSVHPPLITGITIMAGSISALVLEPEHSV